MRTVAAVVFCLVTFASSAFAQAPFPGAVQIDGGWVPCDHQLAIDAGKGCGASLTPPATPPANPTPAAEDPCDVYMSPYNQGGNPTLLARCVDARFKKLPKPSPAVYQVGRSYNHAYPLNRMVVLSVALTVDGVQAVLAQWLTTDDAHQAGDVFAFRNDDGQQVWTLIP